MYNLLFGENPDADQLLAAVGLTRDDVERFRDAHLEGDMIVITSRTGGGNRDSYPQTKMRGLPTWVKSEDDDFDSTYAYDYFALTLAEPQP